MEDQTSTLLKQNFKIDIPTNPTFTIPSIGQTCLAPIQFDFMLLNMDYGALKKNFEFLHALFAGTQWLQFPGGTIKSTNVYNIYVPGRFHIFWASLDMTVTAEGKLRRCEDMFANFKNIIKSIDENTLWPEVWKVTINIKSLTPDNFNTYIHHFIHGFENGTVKLLAGNQKDMTGSSAAVKEHLKKSSSANGSLNFGLTPIGRATQTQQIKDISKEVLPKQMEAARLRAEATRLRAEATRLQTRVTEEQTAVETAKRIAEKKVGKAKTEAEVYAKRLEGAANLISEMARNAEEAARNAEEAARNAEEAAKKAEEALREKK